MFLQLFCAWMRLGLLSHMRSGWDGDMHSAWRWDLKRIHFLPGHDMMVSRRVSYEGALPQTMQGSYASHLFELPGIREAVCGEVSRRGIFLLREHAHHTGNGVTAVVPETFWGWKKETSSPTEKLFLAFLERRLHHRHRVFLGIFWRRVHQRHRESLFGCFMEECKF